MDLRDRGDACRCCGVSRSQIAAAAAELAAREILLLKRERLLRSCALSLGRSQATLKANVAASRETERERESPIKDPGGSTSAAVLAPLQVSHAPSSTALLRLTQVAHRVAGGEVNISELIRLFIEPPPPPVVRRIENEWELL